MVAQLLTDEDIETDDRAAYEQNIKDCATSNFLGKGLYHIFFYSSDDSIAPLLASKAGIDTVSSILLAHLDRIS